MKRMTEIIETMFGQGIAEALVENLLERSECFREDHKKYLEALELLRKEYGACVDEIHGAVMRQSASDLTFAGWLGLKMNLDHYLNPMLPDCTWQQVDYYDVLREDIAHNLPEYKAAEAVLEGFRKKLPESQQQLYDAITEYQSHLVTVGPKLAHYWGYMVGNELLYRCIPGYCPDPVLTLKYTEMLKKYIGINRLTIPRTI